MMSDALVTRKSSIFHFQLQSVVDWILLVRFASSLASATATDLVFSTHFLCVGFLLFWCACCECDAILLVRIRRYRIRSLS